MSLCDKKVLCVEPSSGITFNHEYRAIKEVGSSFYIMNDLGQFKYYNKARFVENGVIQ